MEADKNKEILRATVARCIHAIYSRDLSDKYANEIYKKENISEEIARKIAYYVKSNICINVLAEVLLCDFDLVVDIVNNNIEGEGSLQTEKSREFIINDLRRLQIELKANDKGIKIYDDTKQ